MPASAKPVLLAGLVLLLAGCSSNQLNRFAPPGLVKYEELAGDQPPNPVIQQRINERFVEDDRPFPRVVDAPSKPPVGLPADQQEVLKEALVTARDDLEAEIDAERRAAAADRAEVDLLPEARDALSEQLERENAAAAEERRQPIPRRDEKD